MHIEIITPEKTVLKDEADEVLVPTDKGQIGILPHHINLVTQLSQGEVILKHKGKEKILALTGGFLEVADGKVSIIADYATNIDEINVERAIAARKRAEDILNKKEEGVSQRDFALAEAELRKSLLEIDVATRRKRRNV